ncbi:uncharacterized protein PV09_02260 [Verruconis gallopava]|uniref:C2H2-type domain-containing protein n=1 Tax=Verruconis gallopava TaxID=253628 RepID=A0A0D2B877_9PEZI|nr:uncharacterized protein PV09_02260 [Verruconis gallopava]KIW07419.1 hypothetical protein PV09_02260 [Verruconis gallopava]
MQKVIGMNSTGLSREDVETVQRLRQLYPPHILASLFDEGNSALLTPARESVSSFSSGSIRSSVSSSPKAYNRFTGISHTSSITTISERVVSSLPLGVQSLRAPSVSTATSGPLGLSRSISDYSIREHALNVRSFPQRVVASTPIYFCVHCGIGFEKRADWETHEWIFHERQSFWPCPQPGCQAFFDSGRAFEAHHQAVHGCGRCDHASQVVQLLPERKAWACGFKGCKEVFLDWSKRCKHVAMHYEDLVKRQGDFRQSPEWTYSTTIRNLLRQPELRDQFKKFMTKCHGHSKSAWPNLEWQPDKCAELQRCLEYRDFGRGIPDIIHLAYRLGHPIYSSKQTISRPPTPPSATISPPAVSPRSSSLRSRTRSRSLRSATSTTILSPSSPRRSSSGNSKLYDGVASAEIRISDTASAILGQPRQAISPSLNTHLAGNLSPVQAPNVVLSSTELQRPLTATRKRMVAREPEVRGTLSHALLEFLKEGPPTGRTKGVTRPRRAPRAIPIVLDPYGLGLSTTADERAEDPTRMPFQLQDHSNPSVHDIDRPISPVTEDETEGYASGGPLVLAVSAEQSEQSLQMQQTMESKAQPTLPLEKPAEKETNHKSADPETIQETVLEFEAMSCHSHHNSRRILPPTPGPPPSQLLPLPPPPTFGPVPIKYPDTPTTDSGDVPPSPMPPGFTDIANWPAPPLNQTPTNLFHAQNLDSSPTTETSIGIPKIVEHTIQLPQIEQPERPRTANSRLHPEVVKLKLPPKRVRSSSRSRPRALRWASIGTVIDPPVPSPGVDFRSMISQPLDLYESGSPPATKTPIIKA